MILLKISSFLLIFYSFIAPLFAQSDSVFIRNYQTASYKATAFNYSAIEDERGMLFFANESGVLQYDGSQWKLISIADFSSANTLLKVNDRIYVGGRNEFGYLKKDSLNLYVYTSLRSLLKLKKDEVLTDIWQVISFGGDIYFCSSERILRYDGDKVTNIEVDGAFIFEINNKLFASSKNGLARVGLDAVEYVNSDFKFKDDMAFQYLKGLQGENFIVTAENGIYYLDTVTYKTKKWNTEFFRQLGKQSLYHVVVWKDSLYAVSTYKGGLSLLNKEGELYKSFKKEDGLLGNDLRELLVDRRGNLWVTSDHGLSYLKDFHSKVESSDLNTIVNQITLDDSQIGTNEKQNHFTTPLDYKGSIVFHFATPSFDSQELEYSYYLEGFESKWSAWKPEVEKEYMHLDAGDYIFHVRSRYGEVESQEASFYLEVPASWYKSAWAYLLAIIPLVSLTGCFIYFRTNRLRLTNRKLESIIDNRTQELLKQREQLEIANTELRVINTELDNFVYRSSHDLVAPLKSLKGLVNISQLEEDMENQKAYFNLMRVSIDKLEDFIKSIMEYSSNNKKAVVQEEINLNEVLDDIVGDLKYYDRADKIELIRNVQEGIKLYSDARRIKIILSNLITNSIKYHNYDQENLFIRITSLETDQHIQIDITDNGNGIAEEYLEKIFDMFFRATEKAQGSGLGLYIVKDTVRKIGGEIKVTSKLGEGTTFTLLLPKANSEI